MFYINEDIWGLGIGDWGLGIGDWAQSPIPHPQSPIPNKLRIQNIMLIIKLFYLKKWKLFNKSKNWKFQRKIWIFLFFIFNFIIGTFIYCRFIIFVFISELTWMYFFIWKLTSIKIWFSSFFNLFNFIFYLL